MTEQGKNWALRTANEQLLYEILNHVGMIDVSGLSDLDKRPSGGDE